MKTDRQKAIDKQLKILRRFIEVYCRKNHAMNGKGPCEDCNDLFIYSQKRLKICPYDPKPKCKECPTHCYKPYYREKIREVMRFSGMHYVKRGRIDWLIKYFL